MKCVGRQSPEYIHLLNLISSGGKDKLLKLIANVLNVQLNQSSFELLPDHLPANDSFDQRCVNTSSSSSTTFHSCSLSVSYDDFFDDLMTSTPSPVAPAPAYSLVEEVLYTKFIPAICVFGIAGNCLNLLALTSMIVGHRPRMDRMERSATVGLLALAVADLFFCVTVVPLASDNHIEGTTFHMPERLTFGLLYQVYHSAVITLFITLSTWLTVVMAVSRYLAVCHPLHARSIIGMRFAIESIGGAVAISVILNAPRFLYENVVCIELTNSVVSDSHLTGRHVDDVVVNRRQFYFSANGFLRQNPGLDQAYHAAYLIVGIAMPLALLAYCNFYLIRAIRHSTKLRRQFQRQQCDEQQSSAVVADGGQSGGCRIKLMKLRQQKQQVTIIVEDEDGHGGRGGKQSVGAGNGSSRQQRQSPSDSTNVITLTMTIIVIMNVLMVSPAEISNVFTQMIATSLQSSKSEVAFDDDQFGTKQNNSDSGQPSEQTTGQYVFNVIIAVANTLQTLNFACNFILYCVVNVQFRRILHCLVTCKAWWRHPTGSNATVGSASSYITYTAGTSRTQSPSLRAPVSPSVSERRCGAGNRDRVPASRRMTNDGIGCVLEAKSLTVDYNCQLGKVSARKQGTKYTFEENADDIVDLS